VSGETFFVNACRMLLSGFAFIVFQEIQKKLVTTSLENSYVSTIREKVIKVAGIFQSSTRRIRLILPESYPYKDIWQHLILNWG
jgi:homoserine kinase